MPAPTIDGDYGLSNQNSSPNNPFPPIKSAPDHDPPIAPLSCSVSATRGVA
jgi:hypothetical protein